MCEYVSVRHPWHGVLYPTGNGSLLEAKCLGSSEGLPDVIPIAPLLSQDTGLHLPVLGYSTHAGKICKMFPKNR